MKNDKEKWEIKKILIKKTNLSIDTEFIRVSKIDQLINLVNLLIILKTLITIITSLLLRVLIPFLFIVYWIGIIL